MSNVKQIISAQKSINARSNTNLYIQERKPQQARPGEHVGKPKCANLKDKLSQIPISITLTYQTLKRVETQAQGKVTPKKPPVIMRTSPVPTVPQNKHNSPSPQQLSPSDYSIKSNRSPTNPNPILNMIAGCNRSRSNSNSYQSNGSNHHSPNTNGAANKNQNNYRLANNNILMGISKKNIRQNVEQQSVVRLSPQIEPVDGKRFQFDFKKPSIASNTSNISDQKNSIKSGTSKANLNIQVHHIDKAIKSKNIYTMSHSKDKNSMIDINKRFKKQFLSQLNNYNKLTYTRDGNASNKNSIQHKYMNSGKKYSYQLYHPVENEQYEQVHNHKRYHTIDSGQNCFQDCQMSKFKKGKHQNNHSMNQGNNRYYNFNNHQLINKLQTHTNANSNGYAHALGKDKQKFPKNHKLETLNIIDSDEVELRGSPTYNGNGNDNINKNRKNNGIGKKSKKLLDVDMFLSNYNTNKNNNTITSPPKKTPQVTIVRTQNQLLKPSPNSPPPSLTTTILSQKNTIIQKLHQYLHQKNKELQQQKQRREHITHTRADLQARNNRLNKDQPILNSRLVNLVSQCVNKDQRDQNKSLITIETVFSHHSSIVNSNANSSNNSTNNSKKNTERNQNQTDKNILNDISIQLQARLKQQNPEIKLSMDQKFKDGQSANIINNNGINVDIGVNLNPNNEKVSKKGIVNININNIGANTNEKNTSVDDMSVIARKFDINSIIKGRRRLKTIQQSSDLGSSQKLEVGKKNSNPNIFNTYGHENGVEDIGRYTIYQKLLIDDTANKASNIIGQQHKDYNEQTDQFGEQYQHQFLSGFGHSYQVMDQTLEFIIKSHQNQSKGHNQDHKKNGQDKKKGISNQQGTSKKPINKKVSNSKIAMLQIEQEIQSMRKMGGNNHRQKQKTLQISKWNHRLQRERDKQVQNQKNTKKDRKNSYIMQNKDSREFNNMNTTKHTNHF